jgi:LPXTG-motif cell wall-anchored protein
MLPATGDYDPSLAPFLGLMVLGFLIGIVGHAIRSTPLIALGILLVFLGTVVLPLLVLGRGPY